MVRAIPEGALEYGALRLWRFAQIRRPVCKSNSFSRVARLRGAGFVGLSARAPGRDHYGNAGGAQTEHMDRLCQHDSGDAGHLNSEFYAGTSFSFGVRADALLATARIVAGLSQPQHNPAGDYVIGALHCLHRPPDALGYARGDALRLHSHGAS